MAYLNEFNNPGCDKCDYFVCNKWSEDQCSFKKTISTEFRAISGPVEVEHFLDPMEKNRFGECTDFKKKKTLIDRLKLLIAGGLNDREKSIL
jgi:hypothetical protein